MYAVGAYLLHPGQLSLPMNRPGGSPQRTLLCCALPAPEGTDQSPHPTCAMSCHSLQWPVCTEFGGVHVRIGITDHSFSCKQPASILISPPSMHHTMCLPIGWNAIRASLSVWPTSLVRTFPAQARHKHRCREAAASKQSDYTPVATHHSRSSGPQCRLHLQWPG